MCVCVCVCVCVCMCVYLLGDVLESGREYRYKWLKEGRIVLGGFLSTSHEHDYTSGNAGSPPGGNPPAYPKVSPNP